MTANHASNREQCPNCGESRSHHQMIPGALIRKPLADFIHQQNPAWTPDQKICWECLNRYRTEYVLDLLRGETGQISALNQEVADSLAQQEVLTRNVDAMFDQRRSVGDRVADQVANFGGSWKFIGIFALVMAVWMLINTLIMRRPFDPFPYILLNLVLSCLAAIQAPVIMMSQNRQEAKDRLRGEYDYRINLKAELEIRHIHEKIDLLLNNQWEKLMEIQAIQMEMMSELVNRKPGKASPE